MSSDNRCCTHNAMNYTSSTQKVCVSRGVPPHRQANGNVRRIHCILDAQQGEVLSERRILHFRYFLACNLLRDGHAFEESTQHVLIWISVGQRVTLPQSTPIFAAKAAFLHIAHDLRVIELLIDTRSRGEAWRGIY